MDIKNSEFLKGYEGQTRNIMDSEFLKGFGQSSPYYVPPEKPKSESFMDKIRSWTQGLDTGSSYPTLEGQPNGPEFPRNDWDQKMSPEQFGKILNGAIEGTLGTGFNFLVGLPAMAAGGIAGLGTLATGQGLDKAAENVGKVSSWPMWKPDTPEAKQAQDILEYPLIALHEHAMKQGDVELKRFGSPAYATAVATAIDLLPFLVLHESPEVTSRAIVRMSKELVDPTVNGERPSLTRGEMARRSREIFEEELARQREVVNLTPDEKKSEDKSSTWIKSTEGGKAELPEPVPESLVETIKELKRSYAEKLEEATNNDPVLTALREQGQQEIMAQHESGDLRARESGPKIAGQGPRVMVPVPTTMPEFKRTVDAMEWAKRVKPTVEDINETHRLEQDYQAQAKSLLKTKDYDEAVKASTQSQLYREAREALLGTGSMRTRPIIEFPTADEVKSAGLVADIREFDTFKEANKLLEDLQTEAVGEYGETLKDLDVVQIGDKYRVIREAPEQLPEESFDLDQEKLDSMAGPEDPAEVALDEEVGATKAQLAEQKLRAIFDELAKEAMAKQVLSEDLETKETLPGKERPDIEDLQEADRAYYEDLLAAEGMGEELPLESDAAGVSDENYLREDDYSVDLVDYMNKIINEPEGTTLGSGLGGVQDVLMTTSKKLKKYLKNFEFREHIILQDINKLHLGDKGFDVDLTYSSGAMWKRVPKEIRPKKKFDYSPKTSDTVKADVSKHVPLKDNSVDSIMFDPPFLMGKNSINKGIIAQRFTLIHNPDELLKMHHNSIKEAFRILKPGGKLVVKIQDSLYGNRQVFSSDEMYAAAIQMGFRPSDKIYYIGKSNLGLPKHVVKQRTFKKSVSIFYVFEKPKRSYRHFEASPIKRVSSGISMDEVNKIVSETTLGSGFGGLQDFYDRHLKRQGQVDPFKGLVAKISVEAPFRKLRWENLGFAVKNRFSLQETFEAGTLRKIKELSDLGLGTKEDYGRVTLLHENPSMRTPEMMKKYGKAVELVEAHFKQWLKRYKARGGLEHGFVHNFIEREKAKLKILRETLKKAKSPEHIAKIQKQIRTHQDLINTVKGTNYTPASQIVLEFLDEKNPGAVGKLFKVYAHKVRTIPTLKGLYDEGLLTLDQLDIRKIIGNYGRRAGHDMAMLDIMKAGLKDGAMVKKYVKGKNLVKLDKQMFPYFKDVWMDPRLAQYLTEMSVGWKKQGKFGKIEALVKAAQFLDPTFLGVYDVIQGTMTGLLTSRHLPANAVRAFKEIKNFGREYQLASMNGLYSQPINNVLKVWDNKIENAMHPATVRMKRMVFNTDFGAPIKTIYNAAHAGAWMGDRFVRTVAYLNLRDRGYSPREAAQLAAKVFGDYADVPMATRQSLGKMLFTPTYKIAMFKLYGEMGKSAFETVKNPISLVMEKDAKTGKWRKARLTRKRAMAIAALTFFGMTYGRDKIMKELGFNREYYGWRYYKEVSDKGVRKEIATSFSDPLALPWKYLWRVYKAFKPGAQTPVSSLINSFRYEVHPFIEPWIFDLARNEQPDGRPIYKVTDPLELQTIKAMGYLIRRYVRMFDILVPRPETAERRRMMDKEFGKVLRVLMNQTVFSYIRDTTDIRTANRANALIRRATSEAIKTGEPLNKGELKRLEDMLNSIMNESKRREQ